MKIIIDARTTQDEIKYNGVGRYSRFIIEYLIKNNPDTKFILFMYDSFSTIDEFLKLNPKNVQKVSLGKYFDGGGLNLIKHNLDLFFHISLNKALEKIDLKDCVFFSPFFWRGLPVKKLPTVVTFHDFALPYFNIYSTISPVHNFLRKIHYWNELKNVLKSKSVIVNAEFTLDDFKERFPKFDRSKLFEVLLGVEEDFGQTNFKKLLPTNWRERKYIIYLGGGLTENKNSDGVLYGYKSFAEKLLKEGRNIKEIPYLVIAGKQFVESYSHQAKSFKELVSRLNLNEHVWFTGMYSDFERWDLVKNSFAFIHLSTYEGFGFSVAEAMRSSVPVIAHRGSTYIEVVSNGGILVNGKDKHEVGNAIYSLYTNNSLANEIAKKGYEISLRYDWNICAKETFNIILKAYNG